ncbi:PhzF family phenazine biosynthesis protein [Algihabitans albus]|uniref:PhzF family phenazine biosynthesis protein n=1 Tax=Algihabitans albus TaxID=2164067 RepID=UPI000E5D34B1|nr:PhzF family phenazine biosynthesis protein [Algihabitans albus]
MDLEIYQLDAFTDRVFGGNPAAVVPLRAWLPDSRLQAIALENNLSETAFLVPRADEAGAYDLRWFTPAIEVDLCGHATLASGALLLDRLAPDLSAVRFHTRSGWLEVRRAPESFAGGFAMDLPARPPQPLDDGGAIADALGQSPLEVLRADKNLAVLKDAAAVRAVRPDLVKVAELEGDGLIVTAAGPDGPTACDYVSRYFAPHGGIPEDPVTGSAHCVLQPYWAARLGRDRLTARQVSARLGELVCELKGERVELLGRVAYYLEGRLVLPD